MVTISVKHFCNDTTYIFHQLVSGGRVAVTLSKVKEYVRARARVPLFGTSHFGLLLLSVLVALVPAPQSITNYSTKSSY